MRIQVPSPILYIDAYDSFTNNIIDLLETCLDVSVTVIKINDDINDIQSFLAPFFAVILGPGPGDPRNAEDVGLYKQILQLTDDKVIPVLGICLGFQSLVLSFGGEVHRLPQPRHGIVRTISHDSNDIFCGVASPVDVVQYHSLHAVCRQPSTVSSGPRHSRPRSDLVPLAWDLEACNKSLNQSCPNNPAIILMAVKHRMKPFHGLQFHPESIRSSCDAQQTILNWWKGVLIWRKHHPERRGVHTVTSVTNVAASHNLDEHHIAFKDVPRKSLDKVTLSNEEAQLSSLVSCRADSPDGSPNQQGTHAEPRQAARSVMAIVMGCAELDVPTITSYVRTTGKDVIVLDSESHQRQDVGQFSIIGLVEPDSTRFEYNVGSSHITMICKGNSKAIDLSGAYDRSPLAYLKSFITQHQVKDGFAGIPFWGGLVGHMGYEACWERLGRSQGFESKSRSRNPARRDLSFVFVERSIVISHFDSKAYVQTIVPGDREWLATTCRCLSSRFRQSSQSNAAYPLNAHITLPDEVAYKAAIRVAQSHIAAGNSYELCLTNHATINTPKRHDCWQLYLRLRRLNPAPFAAYVRLGPLTLLSSSPERFLTWSRPKLDPGGLGASSICQFRPIKGTIQKRPDAKKPARTLQQAREMLATPKEMAENLMIVDLIRHDLHGVVGSGNVCVPKLMAVEEYETLFQLVSVIEGTLSIPDSQHGDFSDRRKKCSNHSVPQMSGIDVLAASLPPGSMTGAPKFRSCQLLSSIEGQPRGAYSGVVGYLDVGGGGDFSVVIRSAVRWDDDVKEADAGDKWTIGAGGAITSLSTEEGEYDEMMAKLRSTLRLFEDETTTYDK